MRKTGTGKSQYLEKIMMMMMMVYSNIFKEFPNAISEKYISFKSQSFIIYIYIILSMKSIQVDRVMSRKIFLG